MPISQVYTDKDRKLTLTSEMYNWSSIHPTSMILNFIESLLSIYNFLIIIFSWFNSYLALNTQSNNSVQNIDRIWHATSDNNKLSSSFHNMVVMDFLEILPNHSQLCYKHHKLIPKLTRSNITKKISLSRLG